MAEPFVPWGIIRGVFFVVCGLKSASWGSCWGSFLLLISASWGVIRVVISCVDKRAFGASCWAWIILLISASWGVMRETFCFEQRVLGIVLGVMYFVDKRVLG